MNAPANIDFAARKAQRLAEERWLAMQLHLEAGQLAAKLQDPHINLRTLEIVQSLFGTDTEGEQELWRAEIGQYGIDSEGFPLDWQGCRDWNADREYIPLSVDLERFREGVGR